MKSEGISRVNNKRNMVINFLDKQMVYPLLNIEQRFFFQIFNIFILTKKRAGELRIQVTL